MCPSPRARLLAAALTLAAAAPAAAQQRGGAAPPAPAPRASPAAQAAEEGDGERAMGTWALVVFNTKPFEFPNTGGAAALPLTVYTLGLRHWLREPRWGFRNWGYDLGVGLVFNRSSITQPQTGTLTTRDGPSATGFGLHAGLPLALTHHKHATFEVVPEIDLIYAGQVLPAASAGGDATEYSGWSLRVGARAGFEVYFGFVGLPQLAIEASMGAAITYDSVRSKVGPIERSTRQWGLSTQRGSEPWSVFTGSVAALYHF
ncbi:MAG: hypothetical protein IPO09_08550 [Anaeromyxobacter sp.]|nr:hypothetical protein [Anaeromyxobacter sp.]MBL0277709.1 hypothetical protein [Anaeromyxobacter sp.]